MMSVTLADPLNGPRDSVRIHAVEAVSIVQRQPAGAVTRTGSLPPAASNVEGATSSAKVQALGEVGGVAGLLGAVGVPLCDPPHPDNARVDKPAISLSANVRMRRDYTGDIEISSWTVHPRNRSGPAAAGTYDWCLCYGGPDFLK